MHLIVQEKPVSRLTLTLLSSQRSRGEKSPLIRQGCVPVISALCAAGHGTCPLGVAKQHLKKKSQTVSGVCVPALLLCLPCLSLAVTCRHILRSSVGLWGGAAPG